MKPQSGLLYFCICAVIYIIIFSSLGKVGKGLEENSGLVKSDDSSQGGKTRQDSPVDSPPKTDAGQKNFRILPLKDTEMERLMNELKNSSTKPPIFLIPGLGSTRLSAWKKRDCRYTTIKLKDNIWLNPGKLFETLTIDPHCWIDCLKLGLNQSDPEGCKVRAEEGLNAISVIAPGPIIGGATTVYSWLIEYLAENMGYDSTSILGFPYDWRLSPNKLEERDGFFTSMKFRIEEAVKRLQRPGMVIAHSMGNLIMFYFLDWLNTMTDAERGGRSFQAWVDEHIWMHIGLAAPLLGAAGPLKSVISGEDMGLSVSDEQARVLEVSFGSTNLLNPRSTKRNATNARCQQPWEGIDWQDDIVTVVSEKGAGATLHFGVEDISSGQFFRWMANIFGDVGLKEKYYSLRQDFMHLKVHNLAKPISRPPIKHIIMGYGVNSPTDMGFIYLNNKGSLKPILDEVIIEDNGSIFGERYKKTTGKSDRRFIRPSAFPKSGDMSIPYISLSWAHTWLSQIDYEVERHPPMVIPASISHFLQWAPEKLSEAVAPSTFVPGFDVFKSSDEQTGGSTMILEIEGLKHTDTTRDIFTITTLFEYILPKLEKEMCLGTSGTKTCGYYHQPNNSTPKTKDKEITLNAITTLIKGFISSKLQKLEVNEEM